jgi:hypothetical protein
MALNLLEQDKSTKGGIKAKPEKAGWDDAYWSKSSLYDVLAFALPASLLPDLSIAGYTEEWIDCID